MSIQQQIVLRHRAAGHVRFQLPEQLCGKEIAAFLQQAVSQIDGVYRVFIFRHQRKLSIRYTQEICDFSSLASQFFKLLTDIEKNGYLEGKLKAQPRISKPGRLKQKFRDLRAARWAKEKYTETKETAQAVGVLARLGFKKKPGILKDPEKTFIDFFNDVLVLFLIKTHWQLITQHWLLKPFRYRYEWLAVFYMMYLFMRSKLPKKN